MLGVSSVPEVLWACVTLASVTRYTALHRSTDGKNASVMTVTCPGLGGARRHAESGRKEEQDKGGPLTTDAGQGHAPLTGIVITRLLLGAAHCSSTASVIHHKQ